MDYFKFLPLEILLDILSRLPSESVLDCKSVCKTWKDVVRHPSFLKMHLLHLYDDSGKLGFLAKTRIGNNHEKFHYFEYNENHRITKTRRISTITLPIQKVTRINFTLPFNNVSFLGSCNGLICLSREPGSAQQSDLLYCICNPITNEYVMLPQMKTDYQYISWTSGFGYVSSTNEYKVVRIMLNAQFVEVHVYALGSGNGWRNLGNLNLGFCDDLVHTGFFANEALYWMSSNLQMIVTFDLDEEVFREHLSPPPLEPESHWLNNKIGVLNGFLFFAIGLEDGFYDIWLLRKKNDNHDMKEQRKEYQSMVWSKEFRIDESKLFAVTKTGGVLTYSNCYLNIYDTKTSTSKRLVEFQECIREVFPHKNTLVSLKELGEEPRKIRG